MATRYIRVGDFLQYNGEVHKVITVQRDCPYLENLNRRFVQFTLQKRDGTIVPARNIVGTWKVAKPRRYVLSSPH